MASKHDLLQIRISVYEGAATNKAWSNVAHSLATQAFQNPSTALPVCGILLFSSADWCTDSSRSLPQTVRTEFRKQIGYETQLIGGSMPRLFVSLPSTGEKPHALHFLDKGVVAITIFSRDMWFAVRSLEKPFLLSDVERRRALSLLAKELTEARGQHMGLGSGVQLDLLTIMPGPITLGNGRREFRDEELHLDILDSFKNLLHVFGGSAGDSVHSSCGYQFANDCCLESGLAIALMENDLEQSVVMGHGFRCREDLLWTPVTRLFPDSIEPSYSVSELGGRPATEVLNEWTKQGYFDRGRPVFGIGTNPNCQIAATSDDAPAVGPVRFNRRLPLGTPLFVLQGDDLALRQAAEATLQKCRRRFRAANDLRLFFVLCCAGRFQKGKEFSEESWRLSMELLAKTAETSPLVCFLCSGEFAEDHRRRPRSDSYSLWVSCLSNSKGTRSDTRVLQNRLLRASTVLTKRTGPSHVMDAAIWGAIKSGAEGGQICLADKFIGAILGFRVGHARNKESADQRWDLVIPDTVVRLPDRAQRFNLPESFRSGSVCLDGDPVECERRDLTDDDDILEIVATERCAFFIPDSANPEYHCNPERVQLGKLQAQLAVPLIGSGGDLIGTMQLGFPSTHPMDRTQMGLWVSFSQQTAAALEGALERDERRCLENITDAWNKILQSPTPVGDAEGLLQTFTSVIREQLEATYVHTRVAEWVTGTGRYRLVAPVGPLGELHRAVRPYIYEGEGSVGIAQKYKNKFTNRQEDTTLLYQTAVMAPQAKDGSPQRDWNSEAIKMKSAGILELRYREDFLGALIVDSEDEFFFTERKKRLAEFAAQKLTVLLAKFRAEKLLQQVVHTGLYAAKNIHAIMRPLCLIQRSADILLECDLGTDNIQEVKCLVSAKDQAAKLLVEAAQGIELGESLTTLATLLTFSQGDSIRITWQSPELKTRSLKTTIWLRSAFESLAENACESASKAGEVWVYVWEEGPGTVLVEIQNSGPPVTFQDVQLMWTVGYTTKADHLGIGIPLAHFGIMLAGGELTLTPRDLGGLKAIVSLPLASELVVRRS